MKGRGLNCRRNYLLIPNTENLLKFDAGPASSNCITSMVVYYSGRGWRRAYTLVIKSPTGAMNVSYEGIRCQTEEERTYAYGRNDKTWARAGIVEMGRSRRYRPELSQRALYRYFFCPLGLQTVKDADEAVAALKAGNPPTSSKVLAERMSSSHSLRRVKQIAPDISHMRCLFQHEWYLRIFIASARKAPWSEARDGSSQG